MGATALGWKLFLTLFVLVFVILNCFPHGDGSTSVETCERFPRSAGAVGGGEGNAGLPPALQQGRGPPLRSHAVTRTFDMVVL